MSLSDNSITCISDLLRGDRLSETDLGEDGGVLMDISGQQILSLNAVGLYLVKLLRDGTDSREALVERMMQDFNLDERTAGADLDGFLIKLTRSLGMTV